MGNLLLLCGHHFLDSLYTWCLRNDKVASKSTFSAASYLVFELHEFEVDQS